MQVSGINVLDANICFLCSLDYFLLTNVIVLGRFVLDHTLPRFLNQTGKNQNVVVRFVLHDELQKSRFH